MLKWRTINYKMKAPPARREPREILLGSRRESDRARGRRKKGEKEREIRSYVDSICTVCCLSAMGIGLDWIAASAIQTLEASMWVGLSRSCFKLKLHFPDRPRRSSKPPSTIQPHNFPSRCRFSFVVSTASKILPKFSAKTESIVHSSHRNASGTFNRKPTVAYNFTL